MIIDKNYFRCHSWLIYWFGRANKCENNACNFENPKRFEWALRKKYNYEKNRNNYIMLCPSCHRKYDMTDEIRNKMSKSKKGCDAKNKTPIESISSNGVLIKYLSITQAYNETGISITSINNNLKNKSKTAGGLIWHYQQKN